MNYLTCKETAFTGQISKPLSALNLPLLTSEKEFGKSWSSGVITLINVFEIHLILKGYNP